LDSRYIRIYKTPLFKKKKVRKIHGAFEENGMWFYCWNCGFINKVDRNANADGYNTPISFADEGGPFDSRYDDRSLNVCYFDSFYTLGTIIKEYNQTVAAGESGPVYRTQFKSNIVKGCSLCGATNIYGGN
jgi:hypothetical protein